MKEYHYYDYLKKKTKYADFLHYELGKRIYYFGRHFKNSLENNVQKKRIVDYHLVRCFYFLYRAFLSKADSTKGSIISNVYFNFGRDLRLAGFEVFNVPWIFNKENSILTFKEFVKIKKFKEILEAAHLNVLTSDDFQIQIEEVYDIIQKALTKKNVKAVFLPQDVGFFERLLIDVSQRLSIPTFLVLHGSAIRYGNTVNDNRTDYLCVFGELLKENLVKSGFSREKIITLGHPTYSEASQPQGLRFDFSDILIISKPLPGMPVEYVDRLWGRDKDTNRLKDRGNALLYLWMIQSVLQSIGISQVRLRVHPSEAPDWYTEFLDNNFFKVDLLPMKESLRNATLVIGPSSSMFLDSLFSGVNYTIFEPTYDDGLDMLNDPVGHPFDGSDHRIPVAKDEGELVNILKNKKKVDLTVLEDFVCPTLNMHLIRDILNSR